jgi:O-Antigen ligase
MSQSVLASPLNHASNHRVNGTVTNGKVAFAVLCMAMVTITFNGIQPVSGMSLADGPLALSGAMIILMLSRYTRTRSIPRWHTISAYLLLISALLGALASEGSNSGLGNALRFVITLFGVPIIIGLLASTPRRRTILIELWLASVAINSVVAILDSKGAHISQSLTGFNYSVSGRQAGLTEHPTHLGYVCVLALPVAIVRVVAVPRVVSRLLHVAVVILIGIALLLTGSRVAVAGAMLSILCLPFYTGGNSRVALTTIMGGLILTIGLIFVTSSSTFSLAELEGRSGASFETSDSGHLEDIHQAREGFARHPFTGTGFSNVHGVQDIYLQLLESGGVLALIAFLTFIVGTLRTAILVRRAVAIDSRERSIASALAVGVICWMIIGIIQPPIYDRYLYVGPGLLMAMWLSTRKLSLTRSLQQSAAPAIRSHPLTYVE